MDKSSRNKIAILFFLLLSACSFFSGSKLEPYHTDVSCPDIGVRILIHHTTQDDFWEAVYKFYNAKQERGSKEDYTIFVFRNGHSMQIKNLKVEDVIEKCHARNVLWEHVDSTYIQF